MSFDVHQYFFHKNNEMKKIAFYINTLSFGGAERVMCNLATQFSETNAEVLLITSFHSEKEYTCGEKVRRIFLGGQRGSHFIKRNFCLIKQLRRVLKTERPDILISFMAEPNFRAIIASVGLKNKVVISVRNDPNREYPGKMRRFLAKTLFRLADGIVFQTENAKEWFPLSVQRRSEIIFNQVDKIYYNTTLVEPHRDIVSAGRLTEQKNHKMLIRAFSGVADKFTDNLVIYGEGKLRTELESLISELHMETRIFLPGTVRNLAEKIASSRLFVLSSDYEGMPNALMEAMATGIPCISTDCPCGGPRMLFGELLADRLCACGDAEKLGEKIAEMMTRPFDGKREKILSEQFLPETVFGRWEQYIKKVCE